MNYYVALLVFGTLLLLLGLLGQVKAKELEVGTSNVAVRIVTTLVGSVLIVLSFVFNPDISMPNINGSAEQQSIAAEKAAEKERQRIAAEKEKKRLEALTAEKEKKRLEALATTQTKPLCQGSAQVKNLIYAAKLKNHRARNLGAEWEEIAWLIEAAEKADEDCDYDRAKVLANKAEAQAADYIDQFYNN